MFRNILAFLGKTKKPESKTKKLEFLFRETQTYYILYYIHYNFQNAPKKAFFPFIYENNISMVMSISLLKKAKKKLKK